MADGNFGGSIFGGSATLTPQQVAMLQANDPGFTYNPNVPSSTGLSQLGLDPSSPGGILAAIAGLVGTGVQAFGGGSSGAIGQSQIAAAAADPFASQRQPYQKQLMGMLTDPSTFKTDPGYEFALQQGQQGISRAANALYGTQRAGALAPELAKYTEGYANQAYNDRIAQLMTLSGATTGSPAEAGRLLMQGFEGQGQAIGNIAQGVGGLVNSLVASGIPRAIAQQIGSMFGEGAGGAAGAMQDIGGGMITTPNFGTGGGITGDQGGWPGDPTFGLGDVTGGASDVWGGLVTDPWYG